MTLSLTFHGAAGCVTGSSYLLQTGEARLLIDCGLFQGSKTLKALNYNPFPFKPSQLDAVLLTHAHIDHSGQLPKLAKAGFRGPIHATAGTRDLCEIMLADCGHIQEMEVEHLNRRNAQRGKPEVEAIYTARDAERTLRQFSTVGYQQWVTVAKGVRARWWDAGHILGSASIEVEVEQSSRDPVRLMFSGDVGSGGRDFLGDPEGPGDGVDYLLCEATYGGTERPKLGPQQRQAVLAEELKAAHGAGGPLLMPAFAIERTQELLADLLTVLDRGDAPACEIFLDSPLAIKACEIFLKHGEDERGANPFRRLRESGHLHFLEKPWESDRLEKLRGWHIIMAGSGMCDAGRIRKHLKRLLWRREVTVLLSGFQAQGTLGRLLQEGRKTVRIQGEAISVRSHVRSLDIYSGHADGQELKAWIQARGGVRGQVFLVHGEPESLLALKRRIEDLFAPGQIIIPDLDAVFELKGLQTHQTPAAARLAPSVAASLDWHNARSEFLAQLDRKLENAASDARRAEILAALQKSVAAGGGAPG